MSELRHIKYESKEAIEAKKEILSSQIEMINLLKAIQNYKQLRTLEAKKKLELKSKLNEFVAKMLAIKKHLPKEKLPEIEIKEEKVMNQEQTISLENELKSIQERLAKLNA